MNEHPSWVIIKKNLRESNRPWGDVTSKSLDTDGEGIINKKNKKEREERKGRQGIGRS